MKRCSECEFIYEDDQSLCDMDGHELVFDLALQSFPVNTASATTPPAKSSARRVALSIATAVLVGVLLSVGYSGLTREREQSPQTTKAPATNVTRAPQSLPDQRPAAAAPVAHPTPSPSHSPRLEKTRVLPAAGSPLASSAPGVTSPAPVRDPVKPEPTKANHKKESGIGGFLKKTGKILKRPFKFK